MFGYLKPSNQKVMMPDVAIQAWRLMLKGRYSLLEEWCVYVQDQYKKPINKDTWEQFLEFTCVVKSDLSNYEVDSSWPVLIDDFTSYMKSKNKMQ